MALDPRKQQKKTERRNAKQKAKKQSLREQGMRSSAPSADAVSAAPIIHCCMIRDIWDQGIGQVLISRELPHQQVAFANFLVDVYCLGVKNAMYNVIPRVTYDREVFERMQSSFSLVKIEPSFARKLVEGAVAYARELGLPPHPDYSKAKILFGDIDAGACQREFTYGKDGKPFFFAGPHDTPSRCQQILKTLHDHCGPDGYHFVVSATEESTLNIE